MKTVRVLLCVVCVALFLHGSYADDVSTNTEKGISQIKPSSGPFVKVDDGYMVPYTATIPGTDITFRMVPVPGGSYKMGSPESENGRKDDEGPQIQVSVDPMWVADTEVDWRQYMEFMNLHDVFQEFDAKGARRAKSADAVDAVTAPTPLYDPAHTFAYGDRPGQPATTMTRYAAQQFCKWLSLMSGQQYRMPTEAEWEYAARAGSNTAYSWGDDESMADDYAWHFDNSDDGPTEVGSARPNAFGLYDMHGSVAEWTVNIYTEDGYQSLANQQPIDATSAVTWTSGDFRGVVRGGSWESDLSDLRSASRMPCEDADWKGEDPNVPLSPWWYTDDPTRGIGMRLFRSFTPLPQETIAKFWGPNQSEINEIVRGKVDEGRSYFGVVDPKLPEAISR